MSERRFFQKPWAIWDAPKCFWAKNGLALTVLLFAGLTSYGQTAGLVTNHMPAGYAAAQKKADAFRKAYNFEAAVSYDLAALATAKKGGATIFQQQAVNNLASDYLEQGQVAVAESLLNETDAVFAGEPTAETCRKWRLKGQCRLKQMQFGEAIAHYRNGRELAAALGDSVQLNTFKSLLARAYIFQFKIDSVRLAYDALDYFLKTKDYHNAAYASLVISFAFHASFNLAKAAEYANKTLDYALRSAEPLPQAEARSQLGVVLLSQKKYEEAEASLAAAYSFYRRHNLAPGLAQSCLQLTKLYTEWGQYDLAKANLGAAEKINADLKLASLSVMIQGYGALLYMKLKDYQAADSLAAKAIAFTAKVADKQMLKGVYTKISEGGTVDMNEVKAVDPASTPLLSKVSKAPAVHNNTDYETMLRLNQLTGVDTVQDRQLLAKNSQNLLDIETRHRTRIISDSLGVQKQIAHSATQERDFAKRESQAKTIVLIAVGTLLLVVAASLWLQIKSRRRAEKDKARIELLQNEIHHRVKNNLAVINRLVDVAGKDSVNDASLEALKTRIKSIELLHRHLYSGEARTGNIALQPYLNDLCTAIAATFHSSKNIQLRVSADAQVDSAVAEKLGLIVNELVTNSYKYAFDGKDEGRVDVKATQSEDVLTLVVQDNGVGLPETKTKGSYGMKLIKGLSRELNGTFSFQNHHGTQFQLNLPKAG